ncbi:MAG: sigma-E processing peptidase SpoIIGA [Oscillospiraceae bacterium]
MYIYIDVLVILNWYINYFILLGTAKITHIAFNRKRLVLSSFIGALFSLIILLPTMNYFLSVLIKFLISNILIVIAFKWKSIYTNLKMSLYFSVISFIFAGIMMALENVLSSSSISSNNGVVYADFSIRFLIISTAICYGILCLTRYLMDKNTIYQGDWSLTIEYDGKTLNIDGLADTGNSLTDIFSGKPVIICSKTSLEDFINIPNLDNSYNCNLNGFRLIPFSTIDKGGVIVSFKPDNVIIRNLSNGFSKSVDVLVGVSGNCKKAIFNPKILV